MSHKLKIKGLMAHKATDLEFKTGCNLVTGPNSAGKSSALVALGAVAAHDPDPHRLGKQGMDRYVRRGSIEGDAYMEGVTWQPHNKETPLQIPAKAKPKASPATAGIVDFNKKLGPKEYAKEMQRIFVPEDARKVLEDDWPGTDEQLERTLSMIDTKGWEDTVKYLADKLRVAKADWQAITGEAYGSKKAETWRPRGYNEEYADHSLREMEELLAEATEAHNQANKSAGASEEKVRRGQEAKRELAAHLEEHDAALAELKQARTDVSALNDKISEITNTVADKRKDLQAAQLVASASPPITCPYPACKKGLTVSGDTVAKWVAPSLEAVNAARNAIGELAPEIQTLEAQLTATKATYAATSDLQQKAAERYGAASEKRERLDEEAQHADLTVGKNNEPLRKAAEERMFSLQLTLSTKQKHQKAHDKHIECKRIEQIAHHVGPTGARWKTLSEAVDKIRQALVWAAEQAEWTQTIDMTLGTSLDASKRPEIIVTSDGLPIEMVADNEKLRAQIALQVAVFASTTKKNDNAFLILDATDRLRGRVWKGFVKLMNQCALARPNATIVVAATETACPNGWHEVVV